MIVWGTTVRIKIAIMKKKWSRNIAESRCSGTSQIHNPKMKEKIIYFISWHVINHIKKDVNLFPSNQYCQLNMDEKEGEKKKKIREEKTDN